MKNRDVDIFCNELARAWKNGDYDSGLQTRYLTFNQLLFKVLLSGISNFEWIDWPVGSRKVLRRDL